MRAIANMTVVSDIVLSGHGTIARVMMTGPGVKGRNARVIRARLRRVVIGHSGPFMMAAKVLRAMGASAMVAMRAKGGAAVPVTRVADSVRSGARPARKAEQTLAREDDRAAIGAEAKDGGHADPGFGHLVSMCFTAQLPEHFAYL